MTTPTAERPVVSEQLKPATAGRMTNATESMWLTADDRVLFDNARSALVAIKKTFEMWIVIGEAVVRARQIADERGGRWTFQRLLEQQGLNEIAGGKASISRLEKIMARLPEVQEWRAILTARERIDWAAPNTVFKRCPVFAKIKPNKDDTAEPKPSPIARVKDERDELKRKVADLEERLSASENRDGSLFDLKRDTAKDIAGAIFDNVSAHKAGEIGKYLTALIKAKKVPAG